MTQLTGFTVCTSNPRQHLNKQNHFIHVQVKKTQCQPCACIHDHSVLQRLYKFAPTKLPYFNRSFNALHSRFLRYPTIPPQLNCLHLHQMYRGGFRRRHYNRAACNRCVQKTFPANCVLYPGPDKVLLVFTLYIWRQT